MNVICTAMVNHMMGKGGKVQYSKLYQIAQASKQLIMDWIAGGVMSINKNQSDMIENYN